MVTSGPAMPSPNKQRSIGFESSQDFLSSNISSDENRDLMDEKKVFEEKEVKLVAKNGRKLKS